jgi:hypothetical protein
VQTYTQKLVDAGILEEDEEYFNISSPSDYEETHWFRPTSDYCLVLDITFDDKHNLEDDAIVYSIVERYIEEKFEKYSIMLSNLDDSFDIEPEDVDDLENYINIFKKI